MRSLQQTYEFARSFRVEQEERERQIVEEIRLKALQQAEHSELLREKRRAQRQQRAAEITERAEHYRSQKHYQAALNAAYHADRLPAFLN